MPTPLSAQARDRVLLPFPAYPACSDVVAPLTAGKNGNLYGEGINSGDNHAGCIFELSPSEAGPTETVIHAFSGPDGSDPRASLLFDANGNLYGTAGGGGANNEGLVFELSPSADGTWAQTILYTFVGGNSDGAGPEGKLAFDRQGNLYGATRGGGSHNAGTVFKISPSQGGWVESILYEFPSGISGPGGDSPVGGIVMDHAGRIYGVTSSGGEYGSGAAYELVPENGTYKQEIIHSFGASGVTPNSGLTMDSNGNLYGTTWFGGNSFGGTVYELTKGTGGVWTETTLQNMELENGVSPQGPVVFDKAGNLYATASTGGINGMGSVFMLTPVKSGEWVETVLHRFNLKFPDGEDGEDPQTGVIIVDGRILGTTMLGGIYDDGIVFEITPPTTNPAVDCAP